MDAGTLKKHFATLILSAFGLTVAFFWFDAIKKILEPITTHFGDTWEGVTIVAIIVTFIAIFVTVFIGWMFGRDKKRCEEKGWRWADNDCQKR